MRFCRTPLALAFLLFVGCGGPGAEPSADGGPAPDAATGDAAPPPEPEMGGSIALRFVAPDSGASVAGFIRVRVEEASGAELELDEVVLRVDGEAIVEETPAPELGHERPGALTLPFEVTLDTTALSDGLHALRFEARLGEDDGYVQIPIATDNPSLAVSGLFADHPYYQPGDPLSIDVEVTGPVDRIAGLPRVDDAALAGIGFRLDAPSFAPAGPGHFVFTATVMGDDPTSATAELVFLVDDVDGETARGVLALRLLADPESPFEVRSGGVEGIYRPEGPPAASGDPSAPSVEICSPMPVTLTNGSCLDLCVQVGDPDGVGDVAGLWLYVPGFEGAFYVPVEIPDDHAMDASIELTVEVCLPAAFRDAFPPGWDYPMHRIPVVDSSPGVIEIEVSAEDRAGHVSSGPDGSGPGLGGTTTGSAEPSEGEIEVDIEEVGYGDLQVTLVMDAASDLDLHVVEPGGCEIFYGHRVCESGSLDLDSNPACRIDNVNVENVFFPIGGAPQGDYSVRVNHWQNCTGGGPVGFTVRVTNCGRVETMRGSLTTADRNGPASCTGANWCWPMPVTVEGCGHRVRGEMQYEDRTFDARGFTGTASLPIRFARMEVRRAADDMLLAEGRTDRNGRYEIPFEDAMAEAMGPEVYVNVCTETAPDDGTHRFSLKQGAQGALTNNAHCQRFPIAPDAGRDDDDDQIIEIDGLARQSQPMNDVAGAFNIFDVVIEATDYLRPYLRQGLPALGAFWQRNDGFPTSFYCSPRVAAAGNCARADHLFILHSAADPDEYDDGVLFHEWMHFAQEKASHSDNPGGNHAFSSRSDPRLAWDEGVGNWFGADVRGVSFYLDTRRGASISLDLETPTQAVAAGTSDGTITGRVGEMLVSALLHDLVDGGMERDDDLSAQRRGVYGSIFEWLDHPRRMDRAGTPAGTDLVDFLDGWYCLGSGRDAEMRRLLGASHRNFPYDYGHVPLCR